MNINNTTKMIVTASAAAICISGPWAATPAEAKTDTTGGGTSASSIVEIDRVVALRKMQVARDYVTYPAARAAYAARTR